MRDFRFGVNLWDFASRAELTRLCGAAEAYGFDVALVPDHVGRNLPAPFPSLVAMAAATERLRLGTFTLNIGFWNPHLLAREVAATDVLTDGRLELGLGTGYVRAEFETVGVPWQPFPERVNRIESTLDELERLFADGEAGYDTVQRPRPPLLIGGQSDATLRLAAERADIIGFTAAGQAKGRPTGTLRMFSSGEFADRVAVFRELAGERLPEIEINLLIQGVVVTDDRRKTFEELRETYGFDLTVDELLDVPVLLVGTEEQIVEQLRERRERYGVTYFSVLKPYLDAFGPIVSRVKEG
jgi:probable F420-dependent oxidoreductase